MHTHRHTQTHGITLWRMHAEGYNVSLRVGLQPVVSLRWGLISTSVFISQNTFSICTREGDATKQLITRPHRDVSDLQSLRPELRPRASWSWIRYILRGRVLTITYSVWDIHYFHSCIIHYSEKYYSLSFFPIPVHESAQEKWVGVVNSKPLQIVISRFLLSRYARLYSVRVLVNDSPRIAVQF